MSLPSKCTWCCAAAGMYEHLAPRLLEAADGSSWLQYLSFASLLYADEH